MAYNHNKYTAQYLKENYDQIIVKVPKGKRDLLKQLATMQNITDHKGQISVNRMIINAIEQTYNVDLSKTDPEQRKSQDNGFDR